MTKKELTDKLDARIEQALRKLEIALESSAMALDSVSDYEALTNVVATLVDVRVGLHEVPSKVFASDSAKA